MKNIHGKELNEWMNVSKDEYVSQTGTCVLFAIREVWSNHENNDK